MNLGLKRTSLLWVDTESAIKQLHQHGVPYHIIAVLTKNSIHQPEEIYNYFLNLGVKTLCFNVEEIEGVHETSTLLTTDHEQNYQKFFTQLHRLVASNDSALHIREIHGPIKAILDQKKDATHALSTQETSPYKIINIDTEGNFSTFSPELLGQQSPQGKNYTLGNIHTTPLHKGLQSPTFKTMNREIIHGLQQCQQQCPYFKLCGGGSPSNKLSENGTFASAETQYCRLQKKIVIDTAIEQLEKGLGISHE